MQISDKINIILCIFSFILALISVITVIITLKQNSAMLENTSRAYLSIFAETADYGKKVYYLVIKNFGQSNAVIKSLQCNADLSKFSYREGLTPFSDMENVAVAPNQAFKCLINGERLSACCKIDPIRLNIIYTSNGKTYSESFNIRLSVFTDFTIGKVFDEKNNLKTIAFTLQDINERLF